MAKTKARNVALEIAQFLAALEYRPQSLPINLITDNKRLILLTSNLEFYCRKKHIEQRHHWMCEKVECKKIDIIYLRINSMVANAVTKSSNCKLFKTFQTLIRMYLTVTG